MRLIVPGWKLAPRQHEAALRRLLCTSCGVQVAEPIAQTFDGVLEISGLFCACCLQLPA